MGYIDKELLKASQGGSKLIPEVGGSVRGKYLGWKKVISEKYGNEKYHFKIQLENGVVKELKTGVKHVLAQFSKIAPGSKVEITKTGDGNQTDYDVEVLSTPKVSSKVKDEDEVEADEEETATDDTDEADTEQESDL